MTVCIHNVIARTCTRCNPPVTSTEGFSGDLTATVGERPTVIVLDDLVPELETIKELLASYRSSLDQIKQIAIREMNTAETQDEYNTWARVRILSE